MDDGVDEYGRPKVRRDERGNPVYFRLYIIVGLYDDNRPGEIFLRADKAGSFVNGILDAFAIQTSLGLQYGIPLHVLISKHKNTAFRPDGRTTDPDVPNCTSVLDLLVQWLIFKFPEHAKPPA